IQQSKHQKTKGQEKNINNKKEKMRRRTISILQGIMSRPYRPKDKRVSPTKELS
ncbi:hypothetical protein SK128_023027, partial [Halocaridina rubra]